MRILAIAFSLSLLGGCVDELGNERDATQELEDDVDPTDDIDTDGTNNLPNDRCGDTGGAPTGPTGSSRKKADGSCF
jgi:hypothetical protein